MTELSQPRIYTGGCQCGAIRFCVKGTLNDASICHCRMCQKAFGNFFAPLVSVRGASFNWTRGTLKKFNSSNFVARGFCGDCGTPLTYEAPDGVAVAIGAFDRPELIAPATQFGIEAQLPYTGQLASLPSRLTSDDIVAAPFLADLKSFQHPDHDTTAWPPA